LRLRQHMIAKLFEVSTTVHVSVHVAGPNIRELLRLEEVHLRTFIASGGAARCEHWGDTQYNSE
jgi:hypothetical protein